MKIYCVLFFVFLSLSACQSTPDIPENMTQCPEVRPQVCTMIYAPVCATEKGGRNRTYSSDCTACSHEEVITFQQGMCSKD